MWRHGTAPELAAETASDANAPEGEPVAGASLNPEAERVTSLYEQAWERDNLLRALRQVRRNRGVPGIDGMTVDELGEYLKAHWPRIKDELRHERYRPQPVKRVGYPSLTDARASWAFRRCSTVSSSKRSCRCCNAEGRRVSGARPRPSTSW